MLVLCYPPFLLIPMVSPPARTPAQINPKSQNVDGGFTKIRYDPNNFREVYLDEYTREPLPTELVREAMKEELKYFNDKVWALADAQKVLRQAGSKAIRPDGSSVTNQMTPHQIFEHGLLLAN